MSEEIESGNPVAVSAAPICTCGPDLTSNGRNVHNYACPMTPKCQHMVPGINIQTGQLEERLCGSRLELHFAMHKIGCPLAILCPHCGSRMDQYGMHRIDCPNRSNGIPRPIRSEPNVPGIVNMLSELFEEIDNLPDLQIDLMLESILPSRRVSRQVPQITDGEFEIHGECSICVCPIEQSNQALKPSGCIHCFHETCLMPWVQSDCSNHDKCPDCRAEIGTILKKKFM